MLSTEHINATTAHNNVTTEHKKLLLYTIIPVSILYKPVAGRYRPVRVADGPITARYRFIKNASRDVTTAHNNFQYHVTVVAFHNIPFYFAFF